MPDIFGELSRDWRKGEHATADAMRRLIGHHPAQQPPPDALNIEVRAVTQAPAAAPVNLAPQPQKENPMSLVSDVEQGYQAVKNELGKFEQALPGLVAQGRKLEGNPLAQLAIQAGEHVLNGLIPAEALASVGRIAETALSEALATWSPQQAAQPAAPAEPAPAPAQ